MSTTVSRLSHLDIRALEKPPRLIMNPHAGQKLGLSTNTSDADAVLAALRAVGIDATLYPTARPKHATQLAREAVDDGCKLVIAAGGDGTVSETAEGLTDTDTVLGIMPLGSIMNMARTLCIPRDLARAAEVIAAGRVLAMDAGRVSNAFFLEAAGVGLAAALFGYFERLDSGRARVSGVMRGLWRFLTSLGRPRLILDIDGHRVQTHAGMVTVANGPFVGAAYALAPEAVVDDGLLDVVVFRGASVPRMLVHMVLVAGGRRLPTPPEAQVWRARSVQVMTLRRRQLPVHADGSVIGATPARFEVLPAALRVLVGVPEPNATCAWTQE